MELLTVIAIVGILVTLLLPLMGLFTARAAKANCMSNLKSLYVAANLYTQEQGHWPQVDNNTFGTPAFTQAWVTALSQYGIYPINWTCPTIQRDLGTPDVNQPGAARLDYIGTPFGPQPQAPYKYSTQPWFVERGDVHGDGNMLIFSNGQIMSLSDARHYHPVQSN
jgi:type II secretory pathway pseudopilin PulG